MPKKKGQLSGNRLGAADSVSIDLALHRILHEGTYMHMYRSTPQNATQGKEQEEKEEKEVLRDQLNLDSKDIKVRWKGLSSTDSDEESCSIENSSLQPETDLTQLSQ